MSCMTKAKLPDWARTIEPRPDWADALKRNVDGWEVEARWWGRKGEPVTDGPSEISIHLAADPEPDVRKRGVTTGVMRRLEAAVFDMSAEFHGLPAVGGYQVMARKYVEGRVASLPGGEPRAGGDAYYAHLLNIYDDLVGKGYGDPVKLMADVMDKPKDTVRTQLREARKRKDRTGGGR